MTKTALITARQPAAKTDRLAGNELKAVDAVLGVLAPSASSGEPALLQARVAVPPPALARELGPGPLSWVYWHRPLTTEQILRDQRRPAA